MSILRSSLWATLGNWSQQLISFLTMVIVARLLSPEAFGIFAIAALFILLIQHLMMESIGLDIVREKDDYFGDNYLKTAFLISISFGVIISILLLLFSSFIAKLFGQPDLELIFVALSILSIFEALSVVHTGILRRNSKFKSLALRTLASNLIGGITGVTLACSGFGIWALVYQQLATSFFSMILLWKFSGWKPSIGWNLSSVIRIKDFGIPMLSNAIITVASYRIDILFLSYFCGPSATGNYSISRRVVRTITALTSSGISHAQLTFISSGKHTEALRNKAFFSHIKKIAFITFPIYIGSALIIDLVFPRIFGIQWLDAVPIMQIMMLCGPAIVIELLVYNYLITLGRSSSVFVINAIALSVFILSLFILTSYGAVGVAYGYLALVYARTIFQATLLIYLTPSKAYDFIKSLAPSLLSIGFMVLSVSYVCSLFDAANANHMLALRIFTGISSYTISSFVFQKDTSLAISQSIVKILTQKN